MSVEAKSNGNLRLRCDGGCERKFVPQTPFQDRRALRMRAALYGWRVEGADLCPDCRASGTTTKEDDVSGKEQALVIELVVRLAKALRAHGSLSEEELALVDDAEAFLELPEVVTDVEVGPERESHGTRRS